MKLLGHLEKRKIQKNASFAVWMKKRFSKKSSTQYEGETLKIEDFGVCRSLMVFYLIIYNNTCFELLDYVTLLSCYYHYLMILYMFSSLLQIMILIIKQAGRGGPAELLSTQFRVGWGYVGIILHKKWVDIQGYDYAPVFMVVQRV